ncbi:CapA family protein [Patescibacteria group bacterium]|nr:CapA family protein [Patescibacteria group bacterium]
MSNKYLLFPLFGVAVPILLYLAVTEIRARMEVELPAVGTLEEKKFPQERASQEIVFTGDVLLARNIEQLIRRKGDLYPFIKMTQIFGGAQTVIGNFESAILENHVPTPAYVTTFSTDKNIIPLLVEAGFTNLSLANNHSFDYGAETFAHTVTTLADARLLPFGHPQNSTSSLTTTFTSGDYTIGLLALNQVFVSLPWTAIEASLVELAQVSDYQVAYIHWGDEYVLKHNQTQEDTARRLIDLGIDAVVGHHPHVTQDIAVYNGKPIFYSLGNFLFDQYFSVDVQQGLVLKLKLATSTAEFTLVPISSEGTPSQPHLMPEVEASLFLKNLARRSDPLYAENIAQGKLILPINLATYP